MGLTQGHFYGGGGGGGGGDIGSGEMVLNQVYTRLSSRDIITQSPDNQIYFIYYFIYLFYYSDMYIFYINNKYSKHKKYPALYWAYKSL